MANICSVAMKVVLPTKEKEDFLGLFWDYKEELDKERCSIEQKLPQSRLLLLRHP